MDRYIHEQNLALYRKQLSETHDATRRSVLLGLIARELANEPPAETGARTGPQPGDS
ncbi:MAG: hypothetical protein P4M07_01160 [Xanthobacteraceae bacterium]|nr:hypothetical protein [Xanthobacteraceae bacterium]